MNTDKKRVTVILNQDVYNNIKEIASAEARSITSLVTYILIKYVDDYKNKI